MGGLVGLASTGGLAETGGLDETGGPAEAEGLTEITDPTLTGPGGLTETGGPAETWTVALVVAVVLLEDADRVEGTCGMAGGRGEPRAADGTIEAATRGVGGTTTWRGCP